MNPAPPVTRKDFPAISTKLVYSFHRLKDRHIIEYNGAWTTVISRLLQDNDMINIGVIGYGYWGPLVIRNLNSIEGIRVVAICDRQPQAIKSASRAHPTAQVYKDSRQITRSAAIDCVAIVTPVTSHYALATDALRNGKDIFVEKPFTATPSEAESLIDLAAKKKRLIMVDHTFLFTGAVRKIKSLIDSDTLGRLYYYDSTRVNLGLFQHDVNVVSDLAPHDFSIMDHLIRSKPCAITAHGIDHFRRSLENIAYITIYFSDNIIGHLSLNWLSPVKIRMALIGGTKKMVVWNDLSADEKVRVYDRGIEARNTAGLYKLLWQYRSGDVWVPRVEHSEALRTELMYLADCIRSRKTPINDGLAGLRVVKMVAAANRSLKQHGRMIRL